MLSLISDGEEKAGENSFSPHQLVSRYNLFRNRVGGGAAIDIYFFASFQQKKRHLRKRFFVRKEAMCC